MDQLLGRHNLPKFIQEEIDNINSSMSVKEIESIINNIPNQKAPGLIGLIGEFHQTFMEQIILSLYNLFRR